MTKTAKRCIPPGFPRHSSPREPQSQCCNVTGAWALMQLLGERA